MRTIFCGRKRAALDALDHLLKRGWPVLAVVPRAAEPDWMDPPGFHDGIVERGLDYVTQKDLIDALVHGGGSATARSFLSEPVDLVISYLFPDRVQQPLLDVARIAAINLHPGPLPEYGGLAGYNYAILDEQDTYAVTAHHMDESFDTGDIILRKDFPFDWRISTALDLEKMSRPYLLSTFQEVVHMVELGSALPRISQGKTHYTTKDEFESSKVIDLAKDSPKDVEKKARAFWYPPYEGAYVINGGVKFTVIPECKLEELGYLIHTGTAYSAELRRTTNR